ncbi:hypothetical protein, partial [Methanosarcina sp. 1.H.T.1A.1]|uniref:hypothetical protein n=1 Tax=Methanosarcina sp. 1.H.T.1A.1 TaxID=1483602 RepID=UPI001F3D955C
LVGSEMCIRDRYYMPCAGCLNLLQVHRFPTRSGFVAFHMELWTPFLNSILDSVFPLPINSRDADLAVLILKSYKINLI